MFSRDQADAAAFIPCCPGGRARKAKREDAGRPYPVVRTWFVICCVVLFLLVTRFLEVFRTSSGRPTGRGSA